MAKRIFTITWPDEKGTNWITENDVFVSLQSELHLPDGAEFDVHDITEPLKKALGLAADTTKPRS